MTTSARAFLPFYKCLRWPRWLCLPMMPWVRVPQGFPYHMLLFVGSTFFPAPIRFYLWGIAVLLILVMPLITFRLGKNNPSVQAQIDQVIHVSPSLVERFGLFTIIVLGEVIVGTINGAVEHHDLTRAVGATAVLGMLIAIGLWWIYFDFVSHRRPQPSNSKVSQ